MYLEESETLLGEEKKGSSIGGGTLSSKVELCPQTCTPTLVKQKPYLQGIWGVLSYS